MITSSVSTWICIMIARNLLMMHYKCILYSQIAWALIISTHISSSNLSRGIRVCSDCVLMDVIYQRVSPILYWPQRRSSKEHFIHFILIYYSLVNSEWMEQIIIFSKKRYLWALTGDWSVNSLHIWWSRLDSSRLQKYGNVWKCSRGLPRNDI